MIIEVGKDGIRGITKRYLKDNGYTETDSIITKEEISLNPDYINYNEFDSSGIKVIMLLLRPISWRFDSINSIKFKNTQKSVVYNIIPNPDGWPDDPNSNGDFLQITFLSEDFGDLIIDYVDKQKDREIKLNNIIND